MTQDNLEINVKLNGVDTPLHEISEQTILNLREASKPKPVPVFQVCETLCDGSRLLFKMPDNVARYAGLFVSITPYGEIVYSAATNESNIAGYNHIRELRLDEV